MCLSAVQWDVTSCLVTWLSCDYHSSLFSLLRTTWGATSLSLLSGRKMTQKKQNLNSHPSGGRDLILLPLLRLYHMIEIYLSSVSDVICWPFSADPSRAGLRSRNQTRVISSQQQTLFSCLKQPPLMLRGKRRDLHSSIGLSERRFPRHHVDVNIQQCAHMSHHHWGWCELNEPRSIMNVSIWFISLSIHLLSPNRVAGVV